jgi:hypothetical protein
MTANHSHEYVGRHRKPDPDQRVDRVGPPTDVLRATLALFTHPQTLNRHTKDKDTN